MVSEGVVGDHIIISSKVVSSRRSQDRGGACRGNRWWGVVGQGGGIVVGEGRRSSGNESACWVKVRMTIIDEAAIENPTPYSST